MATRGTRFDLYTFAPQTLPPGDWIFRASNGDAEGAVAAFYGQHDPRPPTQYEDVLLYGPYSPPSWAAPVVLQYQETILKHHKFVITAPAGVSYALQYSVAKWGDPYQILLKARVVDDGVLTFGVINASGQGYGGILTADAAQLTRFTSVDQGVLGNRVTLTAVTPGNYKSEFVWVRFERTSTTYRLKVWNDSEDEPVGWSSSATNSSSPAPYFPEIGITGKVELDFFSVGWNGDEAPLPADVGFYATRQFYKELLLEVPVLSEFTTILDAELPALDATVQQGALLSADLPALTAVLRAFAGATTALDAELPSLEATLQTAHKLNAELPALQAELRAETDQQLSLDAELPALEAQLNVWVDVSPTLNAELPSLEASFVTAHKLSATLLALEAALSLPVSGVISLSAALPAPQFDASVVTAGTATLDATLPAIEARSILLGLSAELPALTARISSSTPVETLTKTAYALNTETGALTDFANFQFLKLGTLNGKLYGLTSAGRLVRLEGDTDDGEPILGYLLTHSDDRIYNDIGELVRTDYLRRCYGVYLKSRNLQGVQVELINDELNKIAYPVMPQMRTGLVNYRVDAYRGIMSHYWALGLRTQGGRFDLFSAALILESLDRKVW